MAKDDEKAKAATADTAKTEAKAATADKSLDKDKPTESIDKPVDVDALREKIRAEEQEKLRAEMVERQEAEAERQAELDAQNSELDEVVCMIDNVHTSKGKMVKGATKNLPKAEADELVAQRKVKRT